MDRSNYQIVSFISQINQQLDQLSTESDLLIETSD